MTQNDKLKTLKFLAKRYARATGQPQHAALDFVAARLGFPHWNELTGSAKGEWVPSEAQVATIRAFVERITSYEGTTFDHIFGGPDAITRGEVKGRPYELKTMLGDVCMEGDGWRIVLPENPLSAPRVEIDIKYAQNSPMNDRALLAEAVETAKALMKSVKARRFADWPRRAMKPDAEGKVRHPFLEMEEASLWYCLHCNAEISGPQIAGNHWHCPGCGASPINIFPEAFWLGPNEQKSAPVQARGEGQDIEPIVSIVDPRPKLDLNKDQVTHLIRSALFEDATNASERMGASLAEIWVDDDLDVVVSFEDHYWPEEKEPTAAIEVAAVLGIEMELEVMWSDTLFAWPGLGTVTQSTAEYTRMMLDAYRSNGIVEERYGNQ
ncbi:hypothetical protein [Tabrizicola sp. TH137]|uniref:hypothetical protein n=1 Tax=Tabrizicola sp. TH137 TaxID=2067452 RepID=UPI0020B2B1CC|nr:hypothetical protein [Tabrizicola sp. TH137]